MVYPHERVEFMIYPANHENETKEFISKLHLERYQMETAIDYNVHGENPITHIPSFKNSYLMDVKL